MHYHLMTLTISIKLELGYKSVMIVGARVDCQRCQNWQRNFNFDLFECSKCIYCHGHIHGQGKAFMIQWFAFSQYFPPDHQNGKIIGQLLSAWTRLWNSLTTVFLSIIFCHPAETQRSPWKLGKLFCMCWQRFFFFFLWFLLCFLSAGLVYAPVRVTGSNMMSKLVLGESNIGLSTQTSQRKD